MLGSQNAVFFMVRAQSGYMNQSQICHMYWRNKEGNFIVHHSHPIYGNATDHRGRLSPDSGGVANGSVNAGYDTNNL